jgi:hypothetical protein
MQSIENTNTLKELLLINILCKFVNFFLKQKSLIFLNITILIKKTLSRHQLHFLTMLRRNLAFLLEYACIRDHKTLKT